MLTDNGDIPAALRGYVQIALDKQLLQAFFTLEQGPFDFMPTSEGPRQTERSRDPCVYGPGTR